MYVLVSKLNDLVVKTRNSKLSAVVSRGEELLDTYTNLMVCKEVYNKKEDRIDREFICNI